MSPIAHVPHCSCATLLMCHIAHVPKRCQIVKKMSSCQKDVKCQKVKNIDYGGGSQKKINWHNEVHTYWRQFWHQIWRSPKLFKNTFYAHFEGFWWKSYVTSKIDVNMCEPHYVNLFFFVNLLNSLCVWFFDIWHLFDNLTSFWQFDIFLTIWHLFDNLTSFWHFDISFNLNHLSPSLDYFTHISLDKCICDKHDISTPHVYSLSAQDYSNHWFSDQKPEP